MEAASIARDGERLAKALCQRRARSHRCYSFSRRSRLARSQLAPSTIPALRTAALPKRKEVKCLNLKKMEMRLA